MPTRSPAQCPSARPDSAAVARFPRPVIGDMRQAHHEYEPQNSGSASPGTNSFHCIVQPACPASTVTACASGICSAIQRWCRGGMTRSRSGINTRSAPAVQSVDGKSHAPRAGRSRIVDVSPRARLRHRWLARALLLSHSRYVTQRPAAIDRFRLPTPSPSLRRIAAQAASQKGRHHPQRPRRRPVYEIHPKLPDGVTLNGHMLYLHGGCYVVEFAPGLYWPFLANLSARLCRTVTVPMYPLAPEHTYREVYPFLLDVYRQILNDHDPRSVVFMGDSAGGRSRAGAVLRKPRSRFAATERRGTALTMAARWAARSRGSQGGQSRSDSQPRLHA